MRLLYAVTAHGLGHWTRSSALMHALARLDPSLELTVSTGLPEALVRADLPFAHTYRFAEYEPGIRQPNCLDMDLPATAEAYLRFMDGHDARLQTERAYLRDHAIDLVVSDISALAVRAAGELGLPAVGVANFTWDWILEPLLAGTVASHVPRALAFDYGHGACLQRLPFGQTGSTFAQDIEAPVLARPARFERGETRRRLDLPWGADTPMALVCLGGWSGTTLPAIEVEPGLPIGYLAKDDLAVHFPSEPAHFGATLPHGLTFPDLVRAADVVVTKPGYGIASECYTQGTPVAFVERPDFREAPALLEQLRARHPVEVLTRDAFAAGQWNAAIARLLASPRPAAKPSGADAIARDILALVP